MSNENFLSMADISENLYLKTFYHKKQKVYNVFNEFFRGIFMNKYFNDILSDISACVKFKSVQTEPIKGMPFGKGCAACLDYFLSLARSFGFETVNYDNYAGEVIFGEGEEFAVLAHLDVVPEGNGWNTDPFGGVIDYDNKKIWGRGTTDDKGPAVIILYCLKALKDEGFKPRKKIKLILGCNEESGWACMRYYKQHAVMPEYGFTPDSDFPVIYAEKGILHVKLKFPPSTDFSCLRGGVAANMVCEYCEVNAERDDEKLKLYNLTYEDGKVKSFGKSAHGSTPEFGINAISPVLKYLGLNDIHMALFGDAPYKHFKDVTGKLSFSPDIIEQTEDGIFVTCDIRYPSTYKDEQVLELLPCPYEVISHQPPLFNDKQGEFITTLCGVYNEVCHTSLQPIAIGGGTYARALKCGAAFGPQELDENCCIHDKNEFITFEKIEKCFKIYKLALERLCG